MRHLVLLTLLGALAGCSKKPADPAPGGDPKADVAPPDTTARDRAYWLNDLKNPNPERRKSAAEELTVWVETDPEAVNGLLALLKDPGNAGAGKVFPTRINSTREAAAYTLARGGPKGEAALKEKGLALLREGLNDPSPAIREHTAYTLGTLGPLARPLSPDVMKLCTYRNDYARGAAFDALRQIGITDPVGFVALLKHEDREVVRLAAQLVPDLTDVPAQAVPTLAEALGDVEPAVRTSAAAALASAGPKAAPAVGALAEAITKTYPKEADPRAGPDLGGEVYWRALAAVGEPAVGSVAGLLAHTNPVVRAYAAFTLGLIGPPAKSAADKLKDALKDSFADVAVEAACALCRIGVAKDDAVALVKRAIGDTGVVAKYAIEAIPRMGEAGKELVPAALARLGDADAGSQVRYAGVGLVGMLDPKEAAKHVAALGKLASDDEPQVRQRVGEVLERLGPAAAPAAEALAKAVEVETDDAVRDKFVDALLAMGPGAKAALPALLKRADAATPQLERRARLFDAVAALDPASKEVADVLLTAVGSPDAGTKAAAASALARLDPLPPEALTKLVAIATTDRATTARVAALRALAAAGPKAKPARGDVEKIAAGKLPEFALLAKVALAAIDADPAKAAGDVRAGLTDRNAQVRAAAVQSLVSVGPTVADVPALVRLLRDPGDSTREAAATCLGRLGPAAKDAVPQLARLLDDREWSVRAAAATALGEVGMPAASPAVEKLKKLAGDGRENDPQAGPAAQKALEKLGVGEKR